MKPLVGALARVPKAVGAGLGQLGEFFSGAKANEAAKRQAATELVGLIDASWEFLAASSSEWKQGKPNHETITALEQYAAALDTWYKDNTLLFHKHKRHLTGLTAHSQNSPIHTWRETGCIPGEGVFASL